MRTWMGLWPPSPPEVALTLIRVGGCEDGAVLFLHLLHVLRQFLDAASDLFHLGRNSVPPHPSWWAR